MRMTLLATTGAALMLAGAAQAQAPSAQQPSTARPPASSQEAPATAPVIKSVNVVQLDELPETTRAQVSTAASKRSPEDNQKLQSAIEAAPMIKKAVEAKGFSARDVLIAQLNDDGELIVVAKKAG